MTIEEVLKEIKIEFEKTIKTATFNGKVKENGHEAKKALVCSSNVINKIHEYIKRDLIDKSIDKNKIFPSIGETKPELKLTGLLKQKKQDICIKPDSVEMKKEKVSWGPLAYENVYDKYGKKLTEQILSINVRSQLSSLAKNSDTLFERTYAESANLHEIHKKMVLGEVYLIPTHEYCDEAMKRNEVEWKEKRVNIEKYISFFSSINGRKKETDSPLKYERCCLLIVDFKRETPKVYKTLEELKKDNLVKDDFPLSLRPIDVDNFALDLINTYHERFSILNLT